MTPQNGGSALKPLSGQINKKIELISLEYEDLMNFQLKSQREYFREQFRLKKKSKEQVLLEQSRLI